MSLKMIESCRELDEYVKKYHDPALQIFLVEEKSTENIQLSAFMINFYDEFNLRCKTSYDIQKIIQEGIKNYYVGRKIHIYKTNSSKMKDYIVANCYTIDMDAFDHNISELIENLTNEVLVVFIHRNEVNISNKLNLLTKVETISIIFDNYSTYDNIKLTYHIYINTYSQYLEKIKKIIEAIHIIFSKNKEKNTEYMKKNIHKHNCLIDCIDEFIEKNFNMHNYYEYHINEENFNIYNPDYFKKDLFPKISYNGPKLVGCYQNCSDKDSQNLFLFLDKFIESKTICPKCNTPISDHILSPYTIKPCSLIITSMYLINKKNSLIERLKTSSSEHEESYNKLKKEIDELQVKLYNLSNKSDQNDRLYQKNDKIREVKDEFINVIKEKDSEIATLKKEKIEFMKVIEEKDSEIATLKKEISKLKKNKIENFKIHGTECNQENLETDKASKNNKEEELNDKKTNNVLKPTQVEKTNNKFRQIVLVADAGSGKTTLINQIINILMDNDIHDQFGMKELIEQKKISFKSYEFGDSYKFKSMNDQICYEFIETKGFIQKLGNTIDQQNVSKAIQAIEYISNGTIIFVQKSDTYNSSLSILEIHKHILNLKSNTHNFKYRLCYVFTFHAGDLIFIVKNLNFIPDIQIKVNITKICGMNKNKIEKIRKHWEKSKKCILKLINKVNIGMTDEETEKQFNVMNKNRYENEELLSIINESKENICMVLGNNIEFKSGNNQAFFEYRIENNVPILISKILIDEENKEKSFQYIINYINYKKSKESNQFYLTDQELKNQKKSKQLKNILLFTLFQEERIEENLRKLTAKKSEKYFLYNKANMEICHILDCDQQYAESEGSWPICNSQYAHFCYTCHSKIHDTHYISNILIYDQLNNEFVLQTKSNTSSLKQLYNPSNKRRIEQNDEEVINYIEKNINIKKEVLKDEFIILTKDYEYVCRTDKIDEMDYNSKEELIDIIRSKNKLGYDFENHNIIIQCIFKSNFGGEYFTRSKNRAKIGV